MEIRAAKLEDAARIYELATSNSLKKVKSGKLEKGFLVSNYTLDLYEKYIANNRYFFVIEDQNVICGFLLAFTREEMNSDEVINKKILSYSHDDFVIVKQICVARNFNHKGYGSRLYSFFMNHIKENIFAAVVLEPINQTSIDFHEKNGFRIAFTIMPEDNLKRAVFFWDNPCNGFYDKEIILNQYERAVDMYIHEDNLNWSKLNNFFYITGGILAITSLWPKMNNLLTFYEFMMAVSFLGILASYLFRIALSSGIEYMLTRKQAVVDLERILQNMKGVRLISTNYNEGSKNQRLQKSPTGKVMKSIPSIMLLIWGLAFLVATVQVISAQNLKLF